MAYKKFKIMYNGSDGCYYHTRNDRRHSFGWQDSTLLGYLRTKLSGVGGTIEVSTRKRDGFFKVEIVKSVFSGNRYIVTAPVNLKSAEFCTEGIKKYLGKTGEYMTLYVRITRA